MTEASAPRLTAADFYDDEADVVADLAGTAQAAGYKTATEVRVIVGKRTWGRVDLLARDVRDRSKPAILVEAKLRIKTLSELRRAVEQASGYRKALGIKAHAAVVAATFDVPIPSDLLLGSYNVFALSPYGFGEAVRDEFADGAREAMETDSNVIEGPGGQSAVQSAGEPGVGSLPHERLAEEEPEFAGSDKHEEGIRLYHDSATGLCRRCYRLGPDDTRVFNPISLEERVRMAGRRERRRNGRPTIE